MLEASELLELLPKVNVVVPRSLVNATDGEKVKMKAGLLREERGCHDKVSNCVESSVDQQVVGEDALEDGARKVTDVTAELSRAGGRMRGGGRGRTGGSHLVASVDESARVCVGGFCELSGSLEGC